MAKAFKEQCGPTFLEDMLMDRSGSQWKAAFDRAHEEEAECVVESLLLVLHFPGAKSESGFESCGEL